MHEDGFSRADMRSLPKMSQVDFRSSSSSHSSSMLKVPIKVAGTNFPRVVSGTISARDTSSTRELGNGDAGAFFNNNNNNKYLIDHSPKGAFQGQWNK